MKTIVPNLVIVYYNREEVIMHKCFSCENRFIPYETTDLFCSSCSYDESKIPEFNYTDIPYRGIITDFKIEVSARMVRRSMNFKKSLARDFYTCRYCWYNPLFNYESGYKSQITVDHINPYINCGTNSMKNLAASCQKCNSIAGGKVFDTFIDKKIHILNRRIEKSYVKSFRSETLQYINQDVEYFKQVLKKLVKSPKHYYEFILHKDFSV